MKIILNVPRAAASGAQNIGDEVEVSADEAKRMIEAGHASPVRTSSRKTEKAVKARG